MTTTMTGNKNEPENTYEVRIEENPVWGRGTVDITIFPPIDLDMNPVILTGVTVPDDVLIDFHQEDWYLVKNAPQWLVDYIVQAFGPLVNAFSSRN